MRSLIAGGLVLLATTAAHAVDRVADARVVDLRPLFSGQLERVTESGRAVRVIGEGASLGDIREVAIESPRSQRSTLHAQDEPVRVILVETDDNLYAIDPFVRIDRRPTEADVRTVFGQRWIVDEFGRSTNRTRFTVRMRAVEALFDRLEDARLAWLRDRGYVDSARTWTNPNASSSSVAETRGRVIEPSGVIEIPADMPRTRAIESVDAGPAATPSLINRGAVVRISRAGTTPVTRISMPGRTTIVTAAGEDARTDDAQDASATDTARATRLADADEAPATERDIALETDAG